MASSSVPSTPTRPTAQRKSSGSPSDKLARARAALLCSPGSQLIALPSAHSSPLSSGSPKTPQSSPPSYKSNRASPSPPTTSSKRVCTSFTAGDTHSAADDDGDWRHRAQSHGIKVTNDVSPPQSNSSGDEQDALPTPSLGHTRTFSEQSPESSMSFYSQMDEDFRASLFTTPPKRPLSRQRGNNVPWDITPVMVAGWVGEPLMAAYTLIDRQSGKTFSHAFIEFSTAEQARAVLRKLQNAVLGKGKRTMAVTVTMSSQEELMTELYPSWTGEFIGACPVITDFTKLRGQNSLPSILSHKELDSLVLLLENPNPRFVKTPALPYYELVGILRKIPQQWTGCMSNDIRDHLYELCSYAMDLLRMQVKENYNNHPDINSSLEKELDQAMKNCPGAIRRIDGCKTSYVHPGHFHFHQADRTSPDYSDYFDVPNGKEHCWSSERPYDPALC
ncbi:hypothetical protein CALCODRAFT_514267 [Calocera cornea HHB12733]|uniref:RRM domain-containing protein n=1 Tax=Calocera cornea HHB12733 TaxID=1353952 RepID=A0A165JR58_9BASI|nr:hypothetical protein CALCODRAFT_514267 [Calocera cornea HHB12733]